MRILVVEDSRLMTERLVKLLSKTSPGPTVDVVREISKAQDLLKKNRYDVAILDIRLPDGSGIDLLKEIKSGADAPTVIMFTGYPFPQYKERCMSFGADYFFDKSTEYQKIPEVIELLANA